jgi:hypothetical protein
VIDFNSLKVRLTLGVALLSSLGLGSVAVWMTWQMQQILIMTHKQTASYVVQRFPHDVEIYSQMLPLAVGIQKTIDNLYHQNMMFWVEDKQGKIVAQSSDLVSEEGVAFEVAI